MPNTVLAAPRNKRPVGASVFQAAQSGALRAVVPADQLPAAINVVTGRQAAIIGRFTDAQPAIVELVTRAGGRRIVQRPYGEELPRIC